MYSIVWKYTIKPEFKDQFEFEYGPTGRWAELFDVSSSYLGSTLHSSVENRNTYLLIDQWSNQEDYKHFLNNHKSLYEEMSTNMKYLYSLEERIGEFITLKK